MSTGLLPSRFTSYGSSRSFPHRHHRTRGLWLQPARRFTRLHSASVCSPAVMHQADELPHEQDENISSIRELFHGMVSLPVEISAYNMAWIAKVPDVSKSCSGPQFPETIDWILKNQLPDGSWGEGDFETGKIRSTLACVIALRKWSQGESCIRNGLKFLDVQISLMSDRLSDDMAVVISALLREAEALGLDLDYKGAAIQRLHVQHERFSSRLSRGLLTEYTVSFVHILEAFQDGPTWRSLLRYQCRDGLLFSLTLTACAYIQTGNGLCLRYLKKFMESRNKSILADSALLIEQARLAVLIERLGIDRYFENELQETLSCLFSFWESHGSLQHSSLKDVALVFNLLRRHGFHVSSNVLRERLRLIEQSSLSLPSSTCNDLFSAEDFLYYGEESLNSKNHTKARKLPFPWYCRIQRIDHIDYIKEHEMSGRVDLLSLAKFDFNQTQKIYQKDLQQVTKWNKDCKFHHLLCARQKHILCYFAPAATIFEPEYSEARIVWAKMGVLTTVVDDYFDTHDSLDNLSKFCTGVKRWDLSIVEDMPEDSRVIFQGLYDTVNSVAKEALALQKRDISHHLQAQWGRFVDALILESEWRLTRSCPSMKEYITNAVTSFALEPIIMSTVFYMGVEVDDEMISHPDCTTMYRRVSLIGRLLNDIQGFKRESSRGEFSFITIYMKENPETKSEQAIAEMRRLIDETTKQLVDDLLGPRAVPKPCKRVFESMLRVLNFFYRDDDGYTSDSLASYVNSVLNVPLQ